MKQKSSNFIAVWFILLVAFVFAGLFTVVGVIGWNIIKSSATKKGPVSVAQTTTKPSTPRPEPGHAQKQLPPTTPQQVAEVPQAVATLPTDPHARFKMGLTQCLLRMADTYPCAWQDTQNGVIKQFKIDKPGEPVVRRVFDRGGNLLSTLAYNVQQHYIIMYRQDDTSWFFDKNGVVRQIAKHSATQPDLQDYYYYTVTGTLNACVCGDQTTACCQQAPQIGVQNKYCDLFPLDAEMCTFGAQQGN